MPPANSDFLLTDDSPLNQAEAHARDILRGRRLTARRRGLTIAIETQSQSLLSWVRGSLAGRAGGDVGQPARSAGCMTVVARPERGYLVHWVAWINAETDCPSSEEHGSAGEGLRRGGLVALTRGVAAAGGVIPSGPMPPWRGKNSRGRCVVACGPGAA